MSAYSHLLSPITVRGKTFKHRITASPTGTSQVRMRDGKVPEDELITLRNKVAGGFSLVSIGETPIDGEYAKKVGWCAHTDFTRLDTPQFDGWKRYCEAAHGGDNLAFVQIFHCGDSRRAADGGPKEAYGPDEFIAEDGIICHAMKEEMMDTVCRRFAQAAWYLKQVGFDGVDVHAAHGWLFSQFLSPKTNHRTDEYGGSIENRCRFPVRIIKAIRDAVGEDFLIEVRVSGDEHVEGGMHKEEMAVFCQMIDGIADIIHVSAGVYRDSTLTRTYSNYYDPHFVNLEQAAYIKAHTKHLLVNLVGGINDPDEAERLIAEGKIDLIALGRQAFADFNFPNKVMEGKAWDINRCARCMMCMGGGAPPSRKGDDKDDKERFPEFDPDMMLDMLVEDRGPMHDHVDRCPVNPARNFKWPNDTVPVVKQVRKVLVVGGGVAGIQAAISASERGHTVTLVEQSAFLGGIMRYTDFDEFKADLRHHKDLMIRRLGLTDTKILLNRTADAALIKEEQPDVILAAVGSRAKRTDLPGAEYGTDVLDLYFGAPVGNSAVVCGGGESGCEAAIWLASRGIHTTLVSRSPVVMRTSGAGLRSVVEEQMAKQGVVVLTDTQAVRFAADHVEVKRADGETYNIPADTIITAYGQTANTEIVEELQSMAGEIPVQAIGDCAAPGKMSDAIADGMKTAYMIV